MLLYVCGWTNDDKWVGGVNVDTEIILRTKREISFIFYSNQKQMFYLKKNFKFKHTNKMSFCAKTFFFSFTYVGVENRKKKNFILLSFK